MALPQTGSKLDDGKVPLDLLDREALTQLGRVLEHGKLKYAAHNWRGGLQWSRTIAAALRHLQAFNDGEDLDPESGLSHVAHAMCNCMFLLRFIRDRGDLDDRYTTQIKQKQNMKLSGGLTGSGQQTGSITLEDGRTLYPLSSYSK